MKTLEHRGGIRSTTFWLVLIVWVSSTVMLVAGVLEPDHWVNITITGVFGWVLRDGATKAAEAYRDRQ